MNCPSSDSFVADRAVLQARYHEGEYSRGLLNDYAELIEHRSAKMDLGLDVVTDIEVRKFEGMLDDA